MRSSRCLVAAMILTSVCAVSAARAQEAKFFQNSWFWGIHAGATGVGTPGSSNKQAATYGAEWLITRSRGGLYVSYDQAQFHRTSQIADPSTTSGLRPVSIDGMRSVSLAGVAFPVRWASFRPYAGLGFSIHVIGDATALPDSSGAPAPDFVAQATEDARSRAAVFLMAGGQWQGERIAFFGQVTSAPSTDKFLITRPITVITAGVRYNFGRAIEF